MNEHTLTFIFSLLLDSTQMPVQAEGSTAEADTHVTFHCK